MMDAKQLIAILGLQPLPLEGGYYRETYRSPDRMPARSGGEKSAGTAIYYLLTPETFSALHRLPTDEVFHFYLGDPVRMLQLHPDGKGQVFTLGPDVLAGQHPQLVVPRGVWQGSCMIQGGKFALLGTTMAPGFDFADYESGDKNLLRARFPAFSEMIERLTRGH